MQKFGAALGVVVLSCLACPFHNPYEKYGESCNADAECGEELGLVCSNGTCQGKPCVNDQACKDLNDKLVCLAGRCAPEGIHDAGSRDAVGGDAASSDARSSDTIMTTPDVYVGDLWIPDLRQFTDSASADQAPGADASTGDSTVADADASTVDSAIADAPAPEATSTQDAAMPNEAGPPEAGSVPDVATPPQDAGSPDGASQSCVFNERLMPDGSCAPLVCDTTNRGCPGGYTCVMNPSADVGICAPEDCTNDGNCGSPMLFCDTSQSVCKPRRGGEYNGCLMEASGQSWCRADMNCRPMGPQSLGVCLRDCQDDGGCGTGYRCLHVGNDGGLDFSQNGMCLAECDGAATLALPAEPMPFDLPTYCSPHNTSYLGLLYAMSTNFFVPCSEADPCPEGPFACLEFTNSTTAQCTIVAEALMKQASGSAHIVPVKNSMTSYKPRCPAGMYPVQDTNFTWLCVPLCRGPEDCMGVVPAPWNPACVNASSVGHCSTLTDTNGQCWLQDHSSDPIGMCTVTTSGDEDGDGWPDDIDPCLNDFGLGNGCAGPGMCRVNSECPSGSFCVAGECKSSTDFCHLTSTGCPSGMTAMGASSACQSSETACVPDAPFGYPNEFCVDDSDCAPLPNCAAANGCRCVANQCQPTQSQGGFYGAQPPPFELIRCQSSLDCPQGGSCYLDENRCEPARKGPPAACVTSTDCPDSANNMECIAGVCAPKSFGGTTCTDETITVSGQSYCLDCMQVNQPNPPWSPGTNLGGGTCPCNMIRGANGYCYRDPSKALCPGGDASLCPSGNFDCIGEHCVPQENPPPAVCGLGADLVGDKCVSCIGAADMGQSWNLPCFASNDPLCPCGLQCLPDAEGNGTCLALGDNVECMDDPPDGSSCEKDGVVINGSCLSSTLNGCAAGTPCASGDACLQDQNGNSFCMPGALPNCTDVNQSCNIGEQTGVCLADVSNGALSRCAPLRMLPGFTQITSCTTNFGSCGPNCVCAPDGISGLMATEIRPQACPAGQWSVGFATCLGLTSLPVVSNGTVGAPCSAGVLPGRVVDDNGTRRCKPSGQTPSPGCGFGASTICASDKVCQLGQCLSSSSCTDPKFESITLPDGTSSCRIKAQETGASCSAFSQFCRIMGVVQGGVCIETGQNSGMCYPRVGCQLALDGETCIDGAPIPLDALGFEPRCSPWSDTPCALVAGGCSYGRCRPVDGAGGLCLDDAECHHWLECGPGQVCRDRSCVQYVVSASITAGSTCDVGPYGYGLDAVVYGQSAMPKTCYLRDDPRCAGKPTDAPCSALYPDPMSGGPSAQGICTSQGACVP